MYDPQEDAVTWPRGSVRAFKRPAAKLIDVVRYSWYVRREDMSPSIARDVFDVLAARAPEALPRRLGGYEPLRFKLDLVGPEGFVSQWNEETMGLFWKTTKPFVGGHTFGLASEVGRPPSPHPVGHVSLSIDARVFADADWYRLLTDLFVSLTSVTCFFSAVADVDRNLGYSGGNITHGPEAETTWGSVARGEWLGLPHAQPWLLWLGGLYSSALQFPGTVFERAGDDGWLLRRAEQPLGPPAAAARSFVRRVRRLRGGDTYAVVANDLRMVSMGAPWRGGERVRAKRVPEGL